MPGAGEILQGRVVGGRFRLNRYLGGSQRSAVFLTERHQREPKTAAIKLVPADPASADLQLSRWKLISQLSHPRLLQLFEMGRCEQDGVELIYLVMEYAEENLADILPSRTLTPDEASEMLKPTLEALAYLHGHGFVHGHLKPANIMVAGEQLKLSSDGICQIGEQDRIETGTYAPPELSQTGATPARDVWSLGVTLVQVLTQLLPVWDGNEQQTLALPDTLPPQFLDLARNCLARDPQRRWTVSEIAAHLQPALPAPAETTVAQRKPSDMPRNPAKQPRYTVAAFAVGLTLVALVGGVKWFNREASQPAPPAVAFEPPQPLQPSPASTVEPSSPRPPSANRKMATTAAPAKAQPPARATLKTASEVRNPAPAPALQSRAPSAPGDFVPAQVVQRVLPDVPRSASNTIRGTVRVTVRVRVDPAGNVSGVKFVSAGPSQYFARLASDAARRWKFSPPRRDGRNVPSEWTVRFEFIRGGTQAIPVAVS